MKKLLFVFAIAALGSLASCKKDYTCTCTTKVDGMDPVSTSQTWEDQKKSDAEEACDKLNDAGGTTTTCELD